MPYKDPERRRQASRDYARRRRAELGTGLAPLDLSTDAPLPTRDELRRALGVQARLGRVPAIRLLLEEYRHDDAHGSHDEDPFAVFVNSTESTGGPK